MQELGYNEEAFRIDVETLRLWCQEQEGIVVTKSTLSVPKPLRNEFYERVEEIQEKIACGVLGEDFSTAVTLATSCREVRDSLVGATDLQKFTMASKLESFLMNPETVLAAPAMPAVLDTLSGHSTVTEGWLEAASAITTNAQLLMRVAYEARAYYGIVSLLHPVKFYVVASDDGDEIHVAPTDEIVVGWQATSRDSRVPEAVFETADGEIYAMKSEAARELDYYGYSAPKGRDTSAGGNTRDLLAHRVLLLYKMTGYDNIPVIVDRQKQIQRPCDVAFTVLTREELTKPAYVEVLGTRLTTLRSKRKVQVLSYGTPAGPEVLENFAEVIDYHELSLNAENLSEIVSVVFEK